MKPAVKSTPAKTKPAVSVVQLWFGENQSMLAVELTRWVDEFRKKYPQAVVTKLGYDKGAEAELTQQLHQAVWGGGLFAERRLVLARDFLKAEAKGELASEVTRCVEDCPPGTVLVLAEVGKLPAAKPLVRSLKALGEKEKITLREFAPLTEHELAAWVETRAKQEGGRFAPGVARLLVARVGDDVLSLSQEVAKLVAYRGQAEVRAVDLDTLVAPKLRDDVFAFLDAVGRRDLAAASAALTRQFSLGTSPQSLVGLLAWHLRVLASVRQALDGARAKPSPRELAAALKLHPFVVSKALQQIPYFSRERIAWLYQELADLDLKLKSTSVSPQALFSVFLGKLANLSVVK